MKTLLLITLLIPTLSFADITKDLKFGMRDSQIKELQQFLINKGYIPQGSKTGYFGAKTLQGVRRYQKDSKRHQRHDQRWPRSRCARRGRRRGRLDERNQ